MGSLMESQSTDVFKKDVYILSQNRIKGTIFLKQSGQTLGVYLSPLL